MIVTLRVAVREVCSLYVYPEGDNSYQYFFYISENTLKAYKKVDGSTSQLASTTYNAANHKWFRIREASGTTYFDTSADGGTWSNFASTVNEFEALAVGVGAMVGTWDTESSTTSAIFDNFNVWHPEYTYDANGNLTSDGTKCYEYNEANQLSKVKECGNNHTIAEYVYDYTGLRTVKKNYVTGTLANTVVSWSDNYETKTPVGGSAQNTAYYWVNGELLAKKDNSGNRFYYQNDHLGSASLLTNSSGAITEETSYDPWGVVKSGGEKSKFQYTGQEKDSETGLNYYNARYYDSKMRRFTQPDDIIQNVYAPQSINRYSYVQNNPIRYTDPTGHYIETGLDIAFIAADLYNISQDPGNAWNYAALAGDIGGTILPGVTGVGLGIKVIENTATTSVATSKIDNARAVENKLSKVEFKAGSKGGDGAGKNFSRKTKEDALRQPGGCVFCGETKTKMHVDHIIPKSLGGNNTPANAQKACVHCNTSKGNSVAPKSAPKNYKAPWPPKWWPSFWRR